MNQIMIVGAGSVGGFFGAHLAKQNPNVAFLLRPGTLSAVRQRGLTIRSAGGSFTVRPLAASDPSELPQPDLIVLAVKAYDLDGVMDQLEPVLNDRTALLTLQNGIDTEDRILARLKRDCVVGGVAFIYSKIAEPGIIDHYKKGAVAIGEFMGHESERLLQIRALFTAAGIPCQLSNDIRRSKWEKMCWNCVFNPITVLINDQVAKALDNPDMMRVIRQIVGEVTAVSAAMKVPLSSDMADKVVKWTQEIRDIHTSMYDDWKAGRPTEIDYLNGFIVRQGREFGIPTPVNEALTALITVMTARERSGPDVVRIEGDVVQPLSLDRRALVQLPAEHRVEDVGALGLGLTGRAVTMNGLLEIPALGIHADHVTIHSQDRRYAATLTLEQARRHGLLLYEMEGKPIPASKGGPFRFIAPGLGDLCAHVKAVGHIEVRVGAGKDTRPPAEERKHC
ncbi:MAG TPA: 2-dehydropantoate 2-reductase [Nitrospiraceae bacterium]|nr:2-dehydropantoate 2-reductase [Nitrospiraceae bacterium]